VKCLLITSWLTVAEHSSLVLHLAACNAGSDWSHDIVAICTET
jgi:hypothetical protein